MVDNPSNINNTNNRLIQKWQRKRVGMVRILLAYLTPPHFSAGLTSGPGFSTSYFVIFFLLCFLRWEVDFRFVDISGIIYHYFLVELFIITFFSYDWLFYVVHNQHHQIQILEIIFMNNAFFDFLWLCLIIFSFTNRFISGWLHASRHNSLTLYKILIIVWFIYIWLTFKWQISLPHYTGTQPYLLQHWSNSKASASNNGL